MAPVKNNKSTDYNPWAWTASTQPEDVGEEHLLLAYRVKGFQKCSESRRNCKRNPYCLWGLGEKKWKEDNEGDEDDDGTAFRCEGEYAGLQNLGATCYVNSLLQLWFHNPIFRPAILKWTPTKLEDKDSVYKPLCPLAQLQAIFARMKISKKSKIDPSDFVGSLLLNTGEQQDAQEFAKLFMDYIVKLLTEYGDDQIKKLIAQSFDGKLQYETECLGCKNKTSRSESFTELNLRVMKNLNESLDDLLADETLSDEYMCSNCRKKTTAKRRMQLLSLPPVLNLQLLRFVYDREAQRRKKVTQNISFPEVLEMQPRIHRKTSDSSSAHYKYHLTAVLIHNGQSASSGHYVAQIKDLRNGEWLKFNDEFVDSVSKGKNQKAKDETEDEAEKKSKQKKSKNSPSLTSSGAYMLVYTLDKYIKNPEPDPELHQYLVDLVKREDASFEEEVYKTKNEKDFETSVKLRRKKEVEWLYEFGKPVKEKSESEASDTDQVDEPKAKVARYENEPSVDSKKKEVINDATTNGNGKSNGCGTDLPARKSSYDLEELDFLAADWITQWLDAGNPVPPIDNGMLCCEHMKLAPPLPNSTPCLYRIVPTPLAAVLYETYQGGPRVRVTDLCLTCVKTQCEKLRALAALEEDSKRVSELIKKCDTESAAFMKTGSLPKSFYGDKCWVNKDCARNWKRMAKNNIEMPSRNHVDNTEEVEVAPMDVGETGSLLFNAELFCEHGLLSPDASTRKLIPREAFHIIRKHFEDAVELSGEQNNTCNECVDAKEAHTAAAQMTKDMAAQQKSALLDLYSSKNRPTTRDVGVFYIVSSAFVTEWRQFIRDPARSESVTRVNNETLICHHGKFKYPLDVLSEFFKETEDADDVICLLAPHEWTYIKDNFTWDHEIKASVTQGNGPEEIKYTPDKCMECATSWLSSEFTKLYSYQDGQIYVVRREKGENFDTDDEETVTRDSAIVTGKREVRPVNPDAWMAGCTSSVVRRSARPRSGKSEKTYKVSSSLTVKELKAKICADFKAMLSDQHLFFNGTELDDITKTLGELRIPTKATLFLEIDTAVNGKVDDPVSTVETGFQGTLLIGGSGFGDNRSPVQNF